MAKPQSGSAQDLNESKAEALSAILQSLSPGTEATPNGAGAKLSTEQVRKLSDKLGQILGDKADSADGTRRNEKGDVVNEEGLPIVDITEPVNAADYAFRADPTGHFDDPDLLPVWTLSPAEKARRKLERERILDLLEAEEREQEQRDTEAARERFKEEMEKRKEAAQKEMDSLKKARDLQKKMGRALMRSVVESRDKAEQDKAAQEEKDKLATQNKTPKQKKSVTFAHDIDEDGRIASQDRGKDVEWGDVVPGTLRPANRQPMKFHVVERHPRSLCNAPLPTQGDSDDESDPGSAVSGNSEDAAFAQEHDSDSAGGPSDSEEGEDDREPDEELSDWNGEDFDFARHQREIAMEYYKKRQTIGVEAASAMRAHSHEGDDEWDQPEVPLEATLASAPPKPSVSRFKASQMSRGPPSTGSLASHSLGASVVPIGNSSAIKQAVRLGKLEDGRLVGGEEGDSEGEVTAEDDNARAMLELLKQGEVTNIGPSNLVATPPPVSAPPEPISSLDGPANPRRAKASKFKLSLSEANGQLLPPSSPLMPSSVPLTPILSANRSSPKSGTPLQSPAIPTASSSQQPVFTLPPDLQVQLNSGQLQMPGMVVDSPSFMPPRTALIESQVSPTSTMSSTSTAVATPTTVAMTSPFSSSMGVGPPEVNAASTVVSAPAPAITMRQSVVERRPPTIASSSAQSQTAVPSVKPKASRFMSQRS